MQNVAPGSVADSPKIDAAASNHQRDIGTSSSTPHSANSSPAKSETETYSEHRRFMSDSSDSEEDSVSEEFDEELRAEAEANQVGTILLNGSTVAGLVGSGRSVAEVDPSVDPETQARLEALLQVAGIDQLATKDGKHLADPEVLRRLTTSVSCALDEAAAALTRMRSDNAAAAAAAAASSGSTAPISDKTASHSSSESSSCSTAGASSNAAAAAAGIAAAAEQLEKISLVEACSDGDVGTVRKLLTEGRSVHETSEEGESLLSLACSAGYFELAQVLLAMHANVEDRGAKGECTPLMEAASAGHLDIVHLLVAHGADVNAQSTSGNTPLMYGCAGGHQDVVAFLLSSGANVEDHNENGHTPLMEAASAGHVALARTLLEHGAGINTHSNEFKESALTLACYKGHLDMVKYLLEAGADQEHKTDEMHTALMEASMDGHVEVARLLLDSGAQVNMPTDSFESPLTLAACGGHVDLAMLLLERGANIEEVNDEGYTPLMEAAREGHEDMVALLLNQGANINAQTDETQETALTLACCGGFTEVADFLIKVGADIELGASTPLMEAAQEGHLELVKYLLESNAHVYSQTQTGDTALTYACENGHTDVADLLLQYGADLEHESEGGRTPLMKACRAGHLCTVQFLLSKGGNLRRQTTSNDHTPLSLACAGGHLAVVELLLHNQADPNHKLKDNSTMLIEAAKGGHTNVVQLLLDYPHSMMLREREQQQQQQQQMQVAPPQLLAAQQPQQQLATSATNLTMLPGTALPAPSTVAATAAALAATVQQQAAAMMAPCTDQPQQLASAQQQQPISFFSPIGARVDPDSLLHNPPKSVIVTNGHKSSGGARNVNGAAATASGFANVSVSGGLYDPPVSLTSAEAQQVRTQPAVSAAPQPLVDLAECELFVRTATLLAQQQQGSVGARQKGVSNEEAICMQKTQTQILEEIHRVDREFGKQQQAAAQQQQLAQRYGVVPPCATTVDTVDNTSAQQQQQPSVADTSVPAPTLLNAIQLQVQQQQQMQTGGTQTVYTFPQQQQHAGAVQKHTDVSPSTAISDRPKAKPVSKKEGKSGAANRKSSTQQQNTNTLPQNTPIVPSANLPSSYHIIPPIAPTSSCPAANILPAAQLLQELSNMDPQFRLTPAKLEALQDFDPDTLDLLKESLHPYHHPTHHHHQGQDAATVKSVYNDSCVWTLPHDDHEDKDLMEEVVHKLESICTLSKVAVEDVAGTVIAQQQQQFVQPPPPLNSTNAGVITANTNNAAAAATAQLQHLHHQQQPLNITHQTPQLEYFSVEAILNHQLADVQQLHQQQQQQQQCHVNADGLVPCPTAIQMLQQQHHHQHQVVQTATQTTPVLTTAEATNKKQQIKQQQQSIPTAPQQQQQQQPLPSPVTTSASTTTTTDLTALPGGGKKKGSRQLFRQTLQQQQQQQQTTASNNTNLTTCAASAPQLQNHAIDANAAITQYGGGNSSGTVAIPAATPGTVAGAVGAYGPSVAANVVSMNVDSETESNHDTALTLACAGGHEDLVDLLISRGADIEHRDKKGFTPLILAATAGHDKVVELLVAHGAEVEAQSERTKDTPLSLACSGGRYEVVELLLAKGGNKEHRNVSDYTPLSLAASGGYVNIIRLLLQQGAEINSRTGSKLGISPLMLAAMNGHTAAVKLLLDMGSDINAQIETNRNTALTLACFQGRHEVVSLLLDRRANVEHRAKTGLTPLMEAASGGYVDVGRVLLDKGADVNATPVPSSRDTALTIAADKGHFRFVELLLCRGAAVEVKNKKGNSPLWLAANGGHLSVVELLYNLNADIDSQDNRKLSCLMAAFRKGHTKVVKWMVLHVNQFPSDQEMIRYIATVSDKELLDKCQECVKVIRAAKETQAAKANQNASILLQELDMEKTREESKRAAAAKRRERKKKKKLEKKEERRKQTNSGTSDGKQSNDQDDDDQDDDEDEDADDDIVVIPTPVQPTPAIVAVVVAAQPVANAAPQHDKEEGDSGIDANSQGSCSSNEVPMHQQKNVSAVNGKEKRKDKKKKKNNAPGAGNNKPQRQPPIGHKDTHDNIRANRAGKLSTQSLVAQPPPTTNSSRIINPAERDNFESTGNDSNTYTKSNTAKQSSRDHVDLSSSTTYTSKSAISPKGAALNSTGNSNSSNKRDEGWKEVVRKSSSIQQQQQVASSVVVPPLLPSIASSVSTNVSERDHHHHHHHLILRDLRDLCPASVVISAGGGVIKKVSVPLNAISRVIGRGGSNINAIRAATGAHIEVEKQSKGQGERIITIKGSAEATKQAHSLIGVLIRDPEVDILAMLPKTIGTSGAMITPMISFKPVVTNNNNQLTSGNMSSSSISLWDKTQSGMKKGNSGSNSSSASGSSNSARYNAPSNSTAAQPKGGNNARSNSNKSRSAGNLNAAAIGRLSGSGVGAQPPRLMAGSAGLDKGGMRHAGSTTSGLSAVSMQQLLHPANKAMTSNVTFAAKLAADTSGANSHHHHHQSGAGIGAIKSIRTSASSSIAPTHTQSVPISLQHSQQPPHTNTSTHIHATQQQISPLGGIIDNSPVQQHNQPHLVQLTSPSKHGHATQSGTGRPGPTSSAPPNLQHYNQQQLITSNVAIVAMQPPVSSVVATAHGEHQVMSSGPPQHQQIRPRNNVSSPQPMLMQQQATSLINPVTSNAQHLQQQQLQQQQQQQQSLANVCNQLHLPSVVTAAQQYSLFDSGSSGGVMLGQQHMWQQCRNSNGTNDHSLLDNAIVGNNNAVGSGKSAPMNGTSHHHDMVAGHHVVMHDSPKADAAKAPGYRGNTTCSPVTAYNKDIGMDVLASGAIMVNNGSANKPPLAPIGSNILHNRAIAPAIPSPQHNAASDLFYHHHHHQQLQQQQQHLVQYDGLSLDGVLQQFAQQQQPPPPPPPPPHFQPAAQVPSSSACAVANSQTRPVASTASVVSSRLNPKAPDFATSFQQKGAATVVSSAQYNGYQQPPPPSQQQQQPTTNQQVFPQPIGKPGGAASRAGLQQQQQQQNRWMMPPGPPPTFGAASPHDLMPGLSNITLQSILDVGNNPVSVAEMAAVMSAVAAGNSSPASTLSPAQTSQQQQQPQDYHLVGLTDYYPAMAALPQQQQDMHGVIAKQQPQPIGTERARKVASGFGNDMGAAATPATNGWMLNSRIGVGSWGDNQHGGRFGGNSAAGTTPMRLQSMYPQQEEHHLGDYPLGFQHQMSQQQSSGNYFTSAVQDYMLQQQLVGSLGGGASVQTGRGATGTAMDFPPPSMKMDLGGWGDPHGNAFAEQLSQVAGHMQGGGGGASAAKQQQQISMYSGTDPVPGAPSAPPTTGGMPAWAGGVGLNPAGYPPAGCDSVDWAALAQQWIIMKEAGPPPQIPMPVQPVQVLTAASSTAVVDMVVENDTDSQNNGSVSVDSSVATAAVQWNWNMPPPNWNATANLPQMPTKPPPLLPTPPQQQPYNNYNQNYIPTWNTGAQIDTVPLQGKIIRPHNKRFSKVNVPVPAPAKQSLPSLMAHSHHNALPPPPPPPPLIHQHHTPNQHQSPHPTTSHHVNSSAILPTLDAARRKQLPAWIRDGLEKMERDKQRQMEKLERDRQRALIAPQEYDIVLGDVLMGASNQLLGVVPSKFNDDMEENGKDVANSKHKAEDSEEGEEDRGGGERTPQPLTHEELMTIVRRTMTEILLKVTNESIKAACVEELQRYNKRKQRTGASKAAGAGAAAAALGLVAAAGASAKLTGTLGLAAYADSATSSESDDGDGEEDEDRSQPEMAAVTVSDDEDSDSHLKEAIRRRKAEFTKTEREIEQRLTGDKPRNSRDRSSSQSGSKSRTSSAESSSSSSGAPSSANVAADGRSAKDTPPSRVTDAATDYAQVDATHRAPADVTGDLRRQRKHRDDRQTSRSKTPVREACGATAAKTTDGGKRRNSSSASVKESKGVEVGKVDKSKTRTTSTTSDNKSKSSSSRRRRSSSRERRRRNDRHRSSSSASSSSRSRSNRRDRDKRRRTRTRSRDRPVRRTARHQRSRSRDAKSSRPRRGDERRDDRRRDRSPNSSRRRSTRSSSSSSCASVRRRRRQSRHDSRQRSSRRSRSRSRSRSRVSRHRRGNGRYSRSRSRSRGSRRK